MKIKMFTVYMSCLLYLASHAVNAQQNQSSQPEEYFYYSKGKKVALTAASDEIFVTFAAKVNLAKGSSYTSALKNQVEKPSKSDVFAPVNAMRYKVNPGQVKATNAVQGMLDQFKRNPDVITAYPAFNISGEKVYVGNKIIYALKSGIQSAQTADFLKNHQSSIVEQIDLGDKKLYVVAVSKGKSTFGVANGLYESGLVEYAEPEFTFSGKNDLIPNDTFFDSQWFLNQSNDADIDAPEAWSISTGSSSVVVAVIDGHGYDLTHPDLTGKLVNSYDAVNNDNFPWPENAFANHGTACVGLIAASTNNTTGVAGVGFNIRALPICIGFNTTTGGGFETSSTIIARAAARVIATPGVAAVSNSFHLGSALGASVEDSYRSMRLDSRGGLGAVILASTGNGSLYNPTVYPASFVNVVGVGASTSTDTRASFSNYGDLVDVVAPGVNTLTTDRAGTAGYTLGNNVYFNGTSAACPVAAGVVGLMASVDPGRPWALLMDDLFRSCDKVGNYTEVGHGRVNAFKALQLIVGSPVVSSFTPAIGLAGTSVTISGYKFSGTTAVTFNNVNASFTVINSNRIVATVPAGAVTGPIRVTNFAGTGTSSTLFTSTSYCVPFYSFACSSGYYINNFSLHTLVNNGSGCNGQTSNYINYPPTSNLTTQLSKGRSYPIRMQSGPAFAQGFGVWIDYNDDKDFDDTGEFVYSSPSAGQGVFTGNITVPSNVSTGLRRLRVRSKDAVLTADRSCTYMVYGETEDYTITIANPPVASSQWNKRFGGSSSDNFSVVIKTSDGGYLLGGHSTSGVSGDRTQGSQGNYDFWIVKTDASGNKQWDKRFGGSAGDYLNAMIRTSDGGYLLGGNSLSGVSGDKSQALRGGQDFWVVKISSTGSKQWDKRFGGTGNDDLRTLHQLSGGEYILTGYSQSGISGDKSQTSQGGTDYWVVKINASGNKVWDKRFGGSGDDWVEASLVNSDGSIVLAGRSASGLSGDKSQASQGGRDFWVVKINSSGSKQWDKRFGGSGNEDAYAMVASGDGGFLVGGLSTSGLSGDKSQGSQGGQDFWVIRLNSTGGKVWDKRFGGSLTEDLRSMIRTSDGGYLLGGRSDSGVSGDKTQASQGGQDYWSVKINSSGSKQWDKRFGGSAAEELRTVLQTSDGGYLLAGRSDSGISGDRSHASQGSTDYWLVKLSSSGGASLIASGRTGVEQEEEEQSIEADFSLQADPNPFTETLTIGFTLPQTKQVQLKVYNSHGLEISTLFEGEAEKDKAYAFEWKATGQQPGMYIIRLGTIGGVAHKKVILVK